MISEWETEFNEPIHFPTEFDGKEHRCVFESFTEPVINLHENLKATLAPSSSHLREFDGRMNELSTLRVGLPRRDYMTTNEKVGCSAVIVENKAVVHPIPWP